MDSEPVSTAPAAFASLYERVRVLRRRLANEVLNSPNNDLQYRVELWRVDLERAKSAYPEYLSKFTELGELLEDAYPTEEKSA